MFSSRHKEEAEVGEEERRQYVRHEGSLAFHGFHQHRAIVSVTVLWMMMRTIKISVMEAIAVGAGTRMISAIIVKRAVVMARGKVSVTEMEDIGSMAQHSKFAK